MQRITPNIWFDGRAQEAVERYTNVFEQSAIGEITTYDEPAARISGKPVGSPMTIEFELEGQSFVALDGGPQFSPNPSISFIVNCQEVAGVDRLWDSLSTGGSALMPLDEYPFSKRYGWLADEFGVSWQIIHVDEPVEQRIVPSLMFVGEVCGRAEEAVEFYTSVFDSAKVSSIMRYGPDQPGEDEGNVMFADFTLQGQCFAAMDSGQEHDFFFSEGVSFVVDCRDQSEVDYFWDALREGGGQESQCGWLKDRFGVSWQVVPRRLTELLADPELNGSGQVTEAMLEMKKLDIEALERAAGV